MKGYRLAVAGGECAPATAAGTPHNNSDCVGAWLHIVPWDRCHWRLVRQCRGRQTRADELPVAPEEWAVPEHYPHIISYATITAGAIMAGGIELGKTLRLFA